MPIGFTGHYRAGVIKHCMHISPACALFRTIKAVNNFLSYS